MNEGLPSQVPPPLPEQYRRSSSFATQAAIFCLWSPFAAFLVNIVGTGALQSHRGESLLWSQLILGGTSLLIIFGGVVFGILALSQMRRCGRKGVLGRAVTGLALNSIVILLMALVAIPAFTKARERAQAKRQAMAKVHETITAAQESARKELLDRDHAPKPGAGSERVEKMQQSLEDAARNMDGSAALVMKASASYMANMNEHTKAYERALQDLRDAKVLSTSSIREKDEMQSRRQTVERFLAANQAFKTFIEHAADHYREEMQRKNIPEPSIEAAMKGYHKQADLINPTVAQIRETDNRIGKGMLGVLDLLEQNWGKWKYQATTEKVRFEDNSVKDQYMAYLTEINKASELQRQLQSKLGRQMNPTQPTSGN